MKKWEDLPRKDLNSIPWMKEKGFEVRFAHNDILHKRTTPDNVPQFSVSFQKGDLHIWRIKEGWQTASLYKSHYENHQRFNTLEEASERKLL